MLHHLNDAMPRPYLHVTWNTFIVQQNYNNIIKWPFYFLYARVTALDDSVKWTEWIRDRKQCTEQIVSWHISTYKHLHIYMYTCPDTPIHIHALLLAHTCTNPNINTNLFFYHLSFMWSQMTHDPFGLC